MKTIYDEFMKYRWFFIVLIGFAIFLIKPEAYDFVCNRVTQFAARSNTNTDSLQIELEKMKAKVDKLSKKR